MLFTGHTLPRKCPIPCENRLLTSERFAERRARVAGEICRLRGVVETAAKQLAAAEVTLSELDALLQRSKGALNPSDIAPIRAHDAYPRLAAGRPGRNDS